jgi:sugar lactone lactonase YvrE
MTLPTPTLFCRYELRSQLGQGGFAQVYRAWDTILRREVALKALLPFLATNPDIRDRFLAEAQALAGMRHPNIVTVYDVGECEGRPYFTMEVLNGETLAEKAAGERQLPLHEVVPVLTDLASALDYIHAIGLVHRDIKGANIMVEKSGRVVLMDFGIARALEGTHYTLPGQTPGTLGSMAPEQIKGEPIGPPADIYALGIMTYQLLAGRLPFTGNPTRLMYAHIHEAPPSLRSQRPDLPQPVVDTVERALAKEPSVRPSSAKEFVAGLRSVEMTALAPLETITQPDADKTQIGPAPATQTPVASPDTARTVYAPLAESEAARTVQVTPSATHLGPVTEPTLPAHLTQPPVQAPAPPRRVPLAGIALAAVAVASIAVILVIALRSGAGTDSSTGPQTQAGAAETGGSISTDTVAGDGDPGVLNRPGGIAVDPSGTLYVADDLNHRVRMVTPDRAISTVAGSEAAGFADGPGPSAQFRNPLDVALDRSGNIYVADSGNNRIRKITLRGDVTTIAGTGQPGATDGAADAAQFSGPAGVAVDEAGNVYVADFYNHRIRKITPDGSVSTLAGSGDAGFADGRGESAQFNGPRSVAVDSAGNVYVADFYNHRIRKITPGGVVSTLAGSGAAGFVDDGAALNAQFRNPASVAIDRAGTIYVADSENRRIRRVGARGDVTTIAGSGRAGKADGPALEAQFTTPAGIAVADNGAVYVSDNGTHRVRLIQPHAN